MTSVAALLTLFDRYDYNAFPVLGHEGRLAGIVSKLDMLRLFVTAGGSPSSLEEGACAADVMQRKVVSVEAEDKVIDAGNLMIMTRLRSVPVVQGRERPKLVGMLSQGDVLRGLRFQLDGKRMATQEVAG